MFEALDNQTRPDVPGRGLASELIRLLTYTANLNLAQLALDGDQLLPLFRLRFRRRNFNLIADNFFRWTYAKNGAALAADGDCDRANFHRNHSCWLNWCDEA